jgi:hypothetical protein
VLWLTVLLVGLGVGKLAEAAYNANMTGTPIDVMTYEGGMVLFHLDNQPTTHSSCNRAYFAIDATQADASVSRLYARLLVAFAQQQPFNIGFDNASTCIGGYVHVYRVG